MIKSIKIQNFETHIKTHLDLHSGVNVIVGESDEGKSGIIRSIKWNAKNRPQGFSYRSYSIKNEKDFVSVDIKYENGEKIKRERNNSKNQYRINNGKPLKALRTDVPNEVKEISKLEEINIQGQHPNEQYFLLADKPGAVAKKFNEVAGLSIVDNALSEINSQIRECNSELKVFNKEVELRETQLKETEWIKAANIHAGKLNRIEFKLQELEQSLETTHDLINNIEYINNAISKFELLDNAVNDLNSLNSVLSKNLTTEKELNTLNKAIFTANNCDLELSSMKDTTEALNSLKSLKNQFTAISDLEQELDELKELNDNFQNKVKLYLNADEEYLKVKSEFEEIKENEICPTCGRTGK